VLLVVVDVAQGVLIALAPRSGVVPVVKPGAADTDRGRELGMAIGEHDDGNVGGEVATTLSASEADAELGEEHVSWSEEDHSG
jgi:hypothetical protein